VEDKEYKKNILHVVTFLKGNTKKVLKNLEKERNVLSKLEEFEKAEVLQRKIDAINYVTSAAYEKFDYKLSPNLDEDIRYRELLELKVCLLKHNVQINNLNRIECFDISNISGTNATGSMAVFVNRHKDLSQYRRFKIKYVQNVPDDFAMMQEVLQRRMRHTEWKMPDLIIVDGGKGQVSSALEVLKENNLDIALIGLAKKEETIVTSNFNEIKLPKDSPALHLIMRIRDEAHRFAITYHKKLRSKAFLS
jgi:excinuclease ABC subunit C